MVNIEGKSKANEFIANFRPTEDNILLEILDVKKSRGGIALPDGASAGPIKKALVISVGPGRMTEGGSWKEVRIQPGEITVFAAEHPVHRQPVEILLEDRVFVVVKERDLIGTLKE